MSVPRRRPRRRVAACAIALCALAAPVVGAPGAATAQQPDQPWLDASRPPDQRANLLAARLTFDQQVSLFSPQPNDPIPELGVPRRRERDGCCGVSLPRSIGVPTTAMPLGISLASTFDTELARDYGRQVGREAWLTGYTAITAPNADLARSPFFGRLNESFGEDPLVNALLPAAVVQGVQENPVYALPKHYVLNLQESRRNVLDQRIDERTLRELYLRPWESIVKRGDPGAIMCAFPRIRGEYACSSRHILQEVLKDEWGFRGWVSSDFNACHSFADFEDGVDICGPETYFGAALRAAVEDGTISRARFADMVHRVLRTLFARGIFDDPPPGALDPVNAPEQPLPEEVVQEGEQLARQVGAAGVVLLKNADRQLPLQRSELDSIAVIGGDADWYIDGLGSPAVPNPAALTTIVDGIAERAGGNVTVEHAPGTDPARIGDTLGGPPPVPSGVLRPAGGDAGARGLRGQYWIGPPQGDPFLTRTDDQVNVRTGLAALVGSFGLDTSQVPNLPVPLLAAPLMSARWSGTLSPVESGRYTLALTHLGSASLSLDGERVLASAGTTYGTRTVDVELTAGRDHAVQIDYAEDAPGQCCAVDATSPGPLVRFAWTPPSAAALPQIAEAAELAASSDVAVVVARTFDGESHDRQSLTLPQDQDRLISAVAAANPNTVVVLATGGPVTMPWLAEVPAVLEAWYAGEAQGRAVADVLFGDENPGGKLPVTFPRSDEQPEQLGIENPFFQFPDPRPLTTYDEGVFMGYRGYDQRTIRPLFPFGHGLSYTRFHYANVRTVDPRAPNPAGRQGRDGEVRVQLRNVGDETGTEVVQVYHGRLPGTGRATPPQQLLGWARVTLDPDERQTVTVPIDIDGPEHPLSYWSDAASRFVAPRGAVQIRVGSSSRDIRRTARLTVR